MPLRNLAVLQPPFLLQAPEWLASALIPIRPTQDGARPASPCARAALVPGPRPEPPPPAILDPAGNPLFVAT